MQGIFINGRRPKSKKEIKEAVAFAVELGNAKPMTIGAVIAHKAPRVRLEATSVFGNEYDGLVTEAPPGTYTFVGPDPYNKRSFYGTIKVLQYEGEDRPNKIVVS